MDCAEGWCEQCLLWLWRPCKSCKKLLSSILFIKINNHLTEICLIRLIITIIIVEIIINYIYVGKKLETESFVWYMYILKLSETLQETWIDITFYNSCCYKITLCFGWVLCLLHLPSVSMGVDEKKLIHQFNSVTYKRTFNQ